MNEAHALTDALLHCAIEAELLAPPATPNDGENWVVGTGATGDWVGQDGTIACRQSGNWIFVAPQDGTRILNRSTGQEWLYLGGWQAPSAPATPTGGTTIDAEARTAITDLITALRASGVFPTV